MSLYGLIIGICLIIGIEYFQKKNNLIPKNKENYFILGLMFFAIIGARVYGVIAAWNYFSQDPIQILNLRGGGLGIFGGLIGGIIFIYIFSKKNKIKFLDITNLIVPIVPLCQSVGRWGNFFNHEIYGTKGEPIWLYESILLFLFFLFFQKIKKHQSAIYLIYYGVIRFVLEFIRTDTIPFSIITFAQFLSLIFIILGIIIIKYENTHH
ncbi:Prolipoprotein diacylglyceryl transferase [bioreactor metagenome]|uniref:Prolipoprotein diacylglyceryl transferase n=1 Tax=bioreactor metagenome TaxID=1076179 RepID=A0A644XU91_9ZZZZ